MKKTVFAILIIVVIINITPVSSLWSENYSYSNYNYKFKFVEEGGGHDFKTAKTLYSWYLKDNPQEKKADSLLYRNFTLKPWRFWEWRDMLFNADRYKLPYKPLQAGKR